LRTKVVDRGRARDPAQPGLRAGPAGIETTPTAACSLERVRREILGHGAVPGQVDEVTEHVVEVVFDGFGEARGRVHGPYTVPKPRASRPLDTRVPRPRLSRRPVRRPDRVRTGRAGRTGDRWAISGRRAAPGPLRPRSRRVRATRIPRNRGRGRAR